MAQAVPRPAVRGPTFIRLLARLAELDVAPPGQPLPEQLGQRLDWKHALSLAAALDGQPAAPETAASAPGDLHAECARAREALATAIREDPLLAAAAVAQAEPDYAAFRQACLARQRAMQATVGRLRGKLRDALAGHPQERHVRERGDPSSRLQDGNPDARLRADGVDATVPADSRMARLAEVDAVMDAALTPHEHALLAGVPELLGRRFERLRAAGHASTSWLDGFRRDMQSVLLAELDLRFRPVDALLAALRTS